jgi:predicted secreted hydrolase
MRTAAQLPVFQGAVIYPDGSTCRLKRDDFQMSVTREWGSAHSGGVYPTGWTLQVPVEGLILILHTRPRMVDQELNGAFIYWEWAVEGRRGETAVAGSGDVEFTGYAQSMQGRF